MDASSTNYGCQNNYYNRCYSGRREQSSLGCGAVRSLRQPGEALTKHCNHRRTLQGQNYKNLLRYRKNQSGGRQKPQRFLQENSWRKRPKGDKKKSALRECVTTLPSRNKHKQRDLRLKILEKNLLKLSRTKKAVLHGYRSKPDKPEPSTAVASGWARRVAKDLRELILSKRTQRNSGAISAKQLNNGHYAQHSGINPEAMFHTRQRRSHSNFKEHRVVSGNKVTLMLHRKVDSNNNIW
jgi:hypothetical protein